MKLKRLLIAFTLIAITGISVHAAYPKIYINPGHGCWTSRAMPTIKHGANNVKSATNDTTNFFETNTNLRKGLALLWQLVEYGVPFDNTKNQENADPSRVGAALDLTQTNIVMSHVKGGAWPAYINGSENPDNSKYNRNLSEITEEATTWGADMFISIHSNAAGSTDNQNTTNFLYFAWDNKYATQGDNSFTLGSIDDAGKTIRDQSIAMSQKAWDHRIMDRHQPWTHYDNKVNNGTVKIAYQNLGVLNHDIPGYLVEGYFHDYSPARHRYMNPGVCALEGIDYARGVADYYGWSLESKGDIYGIVRDKNAKFTHAYYVPMEGTNDVYQPLNNVTVSLKQGETVVATTTTDDEYNGAFIFNNVEPGNYTLEFSHPNYEEYVVSNSSTAITSSSPTALSVTVEAAKTSYPIAFIQGKNIIDDATFTLDKVNSLANYVANKTVRRTIIRDDKLYVLALDASNEPYIYLADLSNNTVTELDKTAVVMGSNGRLKISDIALTDDGVLIANGMSKNHYSQDQATADNEPRGSVNFYKWSKNASTGLPETCSVWFTTNYSCSFYRCIYGKSIAYSGTLNSGYITVYSVNGGDGKSDNPLLSKITISNGNYSSVVRNTTIPTDLKMNPSVLSTNDDHLMYNSPLKSGNCVLDGNAIKPFEWTFGSDETPTVNGRLEAHTNTKANGISFFTFNGNSYLVSPAINNEGLVTGVEIYDVTSGFSSGVLVKTVSITDPLSCSYSAAHAQVLTKDEDSIEIKLYLVTENANTEEPATEYVQGAYAYGHTLTDNGTSYKFAFKSTAAAPSAKIVLTNKTTSATTSYNLNSVKKGDNSLTVNKSSIAEGTYTWAVSIANAANTKAQCYFNQGGTNESYRRGGVAIDLDTESPYFGHVYTTTARAEGIQRYYPDLTKNGSLLHGSSFTNAQLSSPYRIKVSNSKVYIADWSDTNSGVYVYNPETGNIAQMFQGTRKTDTPYKGRWTNNGAIVGGSTPGLAFHNVNGVRCMYALCEDYTDGNMVVRYDLGTANTWSNAPSATFATASALLGHNNVEMVACEKGLWFCQNNGYASTKDAPGFIFMNYNGDVKFSSTSLTGDAAVIACRESGIAISNDMSRLAVVNAAGDVKVYKVTWSDTTPTLTFEHEVSTESTECVEQIVFDPADNMLIFSAEQGLMAYSMVNPARNTVTAAPSAQVISIEETNEEPETPTYDYEGVYPDPVAEELPNVELGTTHELEENGSETIELLSDMTIRRTFVRGDYMYVLAIDNSNAPYIYAINLYDYTINTISTEGANAPTGNTSIGLKISDIAMTADGYLMACNYDHTPVNDTSKVTYIYYWDKDQLGFPTGNPIQWYRSSMAGLFTNSLTGATMCSAGKLNDGTVLLSSDHLDVTVPTGKFRTMRFTKENGSMIIENSSQVAGQVTNVYGSFDIIYSDTYGDKYKYCVSPLNENNFILDGIKKGATELSYEGITLKSDYIVVASENLVDASVTNTSYFKYAGSALMAAPVVSNGQCTGVQMIDVTDGLDNASVVTTMSVSTNVTSLDNIHACGRSFIDGTEGKIDLFLLHGNTLERFTSKSTLVGVENIDNNANAPVEYYNLQGVKVNNPANGIYIKKQGGKATKVIL